MPGMKQIKAATHKAIHEIQTNILSIYLSITAPPSHRASHQTSRAPADSSPYPGNVKDSALHTAVRTIVNKTRNDVQPFMLSHSDSKSGFLRPSARYFRNPDR